MHIALIENPSIHVRGEQAVVLFPSIPYWFSATKEIVGIMKSFVFSESDRIISEIARGLDINVANAQTIYSEIAGLLHDAGVLELDGKLSKMHEAEPHFQIAEVENVLVIATTQYCNMSCNMCYAMAKRKMPDEMTTNDIINIVDQVVEMPWKNNISRIALTGGEIFSRPDAVELIEYVHKKGFFVQINTNATILRQDQIVRLAKLSHIKMSVSLDGCTSVTHEHIRGVGTFCKTLDTISALCQRGIGVAINMFVHADNLDEIVGLLTLADELGVEGVNCLNMMNVGRGKTDRAKKSLRSVSLTTLYRAIFTAIRNNERFQELMVNSTFANQIMGIVGGVKSYSCGIGTNRAVYVKPDGSLYPCADTAVPAFFLGNLRSERLSDIWEKSSRLKELRSLNIDTMNPVCAVCDVRYLCAGNCRGEHYQNTRDLYGPHFKCAEIRESILELMWILTEAPDLFKCKVQKLHETISVYATSA